MLVSQILRTKGDAVFTVGPDQTVAEIAALLNSKRVGALVVLDGDRVAGIVSERDIVRALETATAWRGSSPSATSSAPWPKPASAP